MKSSIKIQAKWVHCVAEPVIENGVVEMDCGQIVAVHKNALPSDNVTDLGEVAVIPGLVNAHTHLEFSHHATPLGEAGMNFVDWVEMVIRSRRSTDLEVKRQAIVSGIKESLAAGVVAIGEIGTSPLLLESYESELQTRLFFERLGFRQDQTNDLVTECEQFLNSGLSSETYSAAISPHAPYSVHPALLEQLVALSKQHTLPVAMHLAESKDEIAMLREQRGKFVELLESLGLWSNDIYPMGTTVLELLKELSASPSCLIIHGNYLTDAEISFISQHRDKISVVYCPRTHDFFSTRHLSTAEIA